MKYYFPIIMNADGHELFRSVLCSVNVQNDIRIEVFFEQAIICNPGDGLVWKQLVRTNRTGGKKYSNAK